MDEKLIKMSWRCVKCNKSLPTKGLIWARRLRNWIADIEAKFDVKVKYPEPYFCDDCNSLVDRVGR